MLSIAEFQMPFSYDSEFYAILVPKFLYPVNSIIFNSSKFLTIVIAYEGYIILLASFLKEKTRKKKTIDCVMLVNSLYFVFWTLNLNLNPSSGQRNPSNFSLRS